MNLEKNIKDTISKKLEDGTIEKLIGEQLEKGVVNALDSLFRSYGDVTKIIETQVKSVMVPYLENYDYSEYITKLDSVLVDVLKSSALDNKNLLENFKELMVPKESGDLNVTDLFEEWMKYVSDYVETDELDIRYEDEPSYECVDVALDVEYTEGPSWSKYLQATILFECDHDESMNIAIPVHRFEGINERWIIDYKTASDINSLRNLNKFEVYLMKLNQGFTRLIIDSEHERNEVKPKAEPEATFG